MNIKYSSPLQTSPTNHSTIFSSKYLGDLRQNTYTNFSLSNYHFPNQIPTKTQGNYYRHSYKQTIDSLNTYKQECNPFLNARPIRYCSAQNVNSSTGMTAWERHKYLTKFQQSQLSSTALPLPNTKAQPRKPIIRSSIYHPTKYEEVGFNAFRSHRHHELQSHNPQGANNPNPDHLQGELLKYSITRPIHLPLQQSQITQKQERNRLSPETQRRSPLNHSKELFIQKQQLLKEGGQDKARKQCFVPAIKRVSQIEGESQLQKGKSLIFSCLKQSKGYPSSIIYNNTAYQLVAFT